MSYYDILGVSNNSTDEEIKKAYRKKAIENHPDKGGNEEEFKKINEAYEKINTNEKRQHLEFENSGINPNIFQNFPFGFNHQRRQPQNQQKETIIVVNLSLEESYTGCKKNITISSKIICEKCSTICNSCNGIGLISKTIQQQIGPLTTIQTTQIPCSKCNGKGKIFLSDCNECKNKREFEKTKDFTIEIPKLVNDNDIIKISNPLNSKEKIILKMKVTMMPNYNRRNNDLYYNLKIPLYDALFGNNWKIPHPSGKFLELDHRNIKNVIKPNSCKIIEGKGMNDNSRLHINFDVEIPTYRKDISLDKIDTWKKDFNNIFS